MLIVCSNYKTDEQTDKRMDGRTDKRIQNDFSEVRKKKDFKQIMKRKKESHNFEPLYPLDICLMFGNLQTREHSKLLKMARD
jgi:hypothetical protein